MVNFKDALPASFDVPPYFSLNINSTIFEDEKENEVNWLNIDKSTLSNSTITKNNNRKGSTHIYTHEVPVGKLDFGNLPKNEIDSEFNTGQGTQFDEKNYTFGFQDNSKPAYQKNGIILNENLEPLS